jgi:hypothetical protein
MPFVYRVKEPCCKSVVSILSELNALFFCADCVYKWWVRLLSRVKMRAGDAVRLRFACELATFAMKDKNFWLKKIVNFYMTRLNWNWSICHILKTVGKKSQFFVKFRSCLLIFVYFLGSLNCIYENICGVACSDQVRIWGLAGYWAPARVRVTVLSKTSRSALGRSQLPIQWVPWFFPSRKAIGI